MAEILEPCPNCGSCICCLDRDESALRSRLAEAETRLNSLPPLSINHKDIEHWYAEAQRNEARAEAAERRVGELVVHLRDALHIPEEEKRLDILLHHEWLTPSEEESARAAEARRKQ